MNGAETHEFAATVSVSLKVPLDTRDDPDALRADRADREAFAEGSANTAPSASRPSITGRAHCRALCAFESGRN